MSDVFLAGKLVPLVLFFAVFAGVAGWALFGLRADQVERMRRIPLEED